MLERLIDPDGLVTYRSPRLRAAGVPHAFTTRLGGRGRLMNFGASAAADEREAARTAVRQALGRPAATWAAVRQVHGAAVACWQRGDCRSESAGNGDSAGGNISGAGGGASGAGGGASGAGGGGAMPEADALVSDDPRAVLSVQVADCVPVLLAGADGRAVAAVHAGWRGVVAGVVPAAVDRLARIHHQGPATLIAAIGPCLCTDHFEIGPEVAEALAQAGFREVLHPSPLAGKAHADLREAVRRQLLRAGLDARRIDTTDRCTWCHESEFFSHRRDHGRTGRMVAAIACRG